MDEVSALLIRAIFRITDRLEDKAANTSGLDDDQKMANYLNTVRTCNCYACRCQRHESGNFPDIV